MKEISHEGKEMLAFQAKLAAERKYAPVEIDLFVGDVREKYLKALPSWCKLSGDPDVPLFSLAGTLLCTGYRRVVIGDYGAFIEIAPSQIEKKNIEYKKGQEYRYNDARYMGHVKYQWLTAKDRSDCKIYFQMLPVCYADYIPGMYYISPYECALAPEKVLDDVIRSCEKSESNSYIKRSIEDIGSR